MSGVGLNGYLLVVWGIEHLTVLITTKNEDGCKEDAKDNSYLWN